MKKILKKTTCVTLIISMIMMMMTGCGGRQAYPVQVSKIGDSRLSCNQLESDMGRINHEIRNKSGQKSKGDNKDAVLVGVGLVLFWPALFFMDLSNADKTELEALRSRHNYLKSIYINKGCK